MIFIDYLPLMREYTEGYKAEQALKRDLAKQNYLNIRDRKKRRR